MNLGSGLKIHAINAVNAIITSAFVRMVTEVQPQRLRLSARVAYSCN